MGLPSHWSTGIGAACARRFAGEGGRVVASQTKEHCRELVEEIRAAGGKGALRGGRR